MAAETDDVILTLRRVQALCDEHVKVVHIDAGSYHSAMVTDDGNAYCCGLNEHGKL